MSRKSHAIEWNIDPEIEIETKIKIEPIDEVIQTKTNTVSVTALNKRAYEGHKATVILGKHKVTSHQIVVREGVRIWTCKIDGRGAVSSIGLPGMDVTVIVHGANK